MRKKLVLFTSGAALVLALLGLPLAGDADNETAVLVHVGLNPSTCGTIPGSNSGAVKIHFNAVKDRLKVNVSVHDALPNTLYVVDIRCVGEIGGLTTNSQGTGTEQIDLPMPPAAPFYIDVAVPPPGGGGAGGYGDSFIAGPFNLN